MTATNETLSMATEAQLKRDLPQSIVIPPIRGEMVHLRPATVEDLPRLDELDAFYGASKITGKDAVTERAIVHTWVRRSQAWESRRTIAWAVLTDADHDDDGQLDAASTDNVIGMIFLIDIDGWSKSARIQIILGREYRGRGYSRDAMPRVMTYGFAPEPASRSASCRPAPRATRCGMPKTTNTRTLSSWTRWSTSTIRFVRLTLLVCT